MSGLRLSFRLAWRAAGRERFATFLTALLVALPVVALVAAGVLARSVTIPDHLQEERSTGQSKLSASTYQTSPGGAVNVDPPTALLPAGSRVLADVTRNSDLLLTPADAVEGTVDPSELDYSDPLARGMVVQRDGRAPRGADEVTVTTFLAGHFHLHVGDTLRLKALGSRRIVGTVVDPKYVRAREIYSVDGAFKALPASSATFLIAPPRSVDPATVSLPAPYNLDRHFGSGGASRPDSNTINSGALVILLALLEASLTAGTAFAVGARRRRRDLALIAVNGGRPAHTGGVVLANGLVCGVIGVVVGLAGGVGAARLGFPILARHSSELLPGLRVEPWLLLAAAAFGLLSSLLSAGFPAVLAARGSLRHALGKARGSSGTPGWITVAGVAVFGLGVAVTAAAVGDASTGNAQQTSTALLGVVFVEIGAVATCPALLGLAGRLGARLPALPRLALRDAARQRARSGPAVAAVAAAVSGAMALSVYLASDHLAQARSYQPQVPRDLVTVSLTNDQLGPLSGAEGVGPRPDSALTSLLGADTVARSVPSHDLADDNGNVLYAGSGDQATGNGGFGTDIGGPVVVAGPELLRLFGASPAARQALTRGLAVVGSSAPRPRSLRFATPDGYAKQSVSAPVETVDAGWAIVPGLPTVVVSPATADRVLASLSPARAPGAATASSERDSQLWAPLVRDLSNSARSKLGNRASDLGVLLTIDAGPGDTDALASLALLGVAAAFSLVVTAAATVLAAAESRADLSILGAVGATGLTRRLFTAAQGSTTALLGGALGIIIGLVPGIAVVHSSIKSLPLTIPWQPFVAFLIGLPLLAAVGGLIFSRSRLPGVTRTV